jgi:hypothetical protein
MFVAAMMMMLFMSVDALDNPSKGTGLDVRVVRDENCYLL